MPVLVGFVPTTEGRAAVRRAVHECRLRETRLIVVSSEQTPAATFVERRPALEASAGEVRAICAEMGLAEPDLEIRWIRDAYEPADDVLAVTVDQRSSITDPVPGGDVFTLSVTGVEARSSVDAVTGGESPGEGDGRAADRSPD